MESTVKLPPVPRKVGLTKSDIYISFICPSNITLEYPMANLLLNYTEDGYKVNYGKNWIKEYIAQAIKRSPYIKQDQVEAAQYV